VAGDLVVAGVFALGEKATWTPGCSRVRATLMPWGLPARAWEQQSGRWCRIGGALKDDQLVEMNVGCDGGDGAGDVAEVGS